MTPLAHASRFGRIDSAKDGRQNVLRMFCNFSVILLLSIFLFCFVTTVAFETKIVIISWNSCRV